MPPRTLASLAHALSAASNLDAALVALAEAVAEADRSARLVLLQYDARRTMLRDQLDPVGGRVERRRVDMIFDHLPARVRSVLLAGGRFADVGDQAAACARLLGMHPVQDDGSLSLRGVQTDGVLAAVIALYEPKRIFGPRAVERIGPYVALFELAFARFAEREAREEAVRTLEDVTHRVHGEYVRKLGALERELAEARAHAGRAEAGVDPARLVALEADAARAREEARRATGRAKSTEQQLTAAVAQLEHDHVELHRRSEALRQRTRTLYLIDRVLALDASTAHPRKLVDGLLALVGDDMQAQRCSLLLRVPDGDELYIAAAKGLAPEISEGTRIGMGRGVAGKVAASREPLLVTDAAEAASHPLLRDEYLTTGSFISFPLIYHDELIGVVNLTNRAQRGVFMEEDVERVRLLALVISLIASHAALPVRLLETIGVR